MSVTICAFAGAFRLQRYAVFPVHVPNSKRHSAFLARTARTHASPSDVPPGTAMGPCPMKETSVARVGPNRSGVNTGSMSCSRVVGSGRNAPVFFMMARNFSRFARSMPKATSATSPKSHPASAIVSVHVGSAGGTAPPRDQFYPETSPRSGQCASASSSCRRTSRDRVRSAVRRTDSTDLRQAVQRREELLRRDVYGADALAT